MISGLAPSFCSKGEVVKPGRAAGDVGARVRGDWGDEAITLLRRCGSSAPNMLGFRWRFIALGRTFFPPFALTAASARVTLETPVLAGDLGLATFPLRSGEAAIGSFDFAFTFLSAGANPAPSFTLIFFAPLLRIFSSSSDDGYDESLISARATEACCMSRLTSCAKVPNDGGRLIPVVDSLRGGVALMSFGGGMGAQKESDLLTRCTLGSGKASPLPMEMEDAEVKERLDEVLWRTRLWCAEKDDRELRVDELGVEGVAREVLLGRIGDERRRGYVREVFREYG